MKISDGINILNAEKILGRTPKGRPLNQFAIESLDATLQDIKNQDNELSQCLGCGFIISILLFTTKSFFPCLSSLCRKAICLYTSYFCNAPLSWISDNYMAEDMREKGNLILI